MGCAQIGQRGGECSLLLALSLDMKVTVWKRCAALWRSTQGGGGAPRGNKERSITEKWLWD